MVPFEDTDAVNATNWILGHGGPVPTDDCTTGSDGKHMIASTKCGRTLHQVDGAGIPEVDTAFARTLADEASPLARFVSRAIAVAT